MEIAEANHSTQLDLMNRNNLSSRTRTACYSRRRPVLMALLVWSSTSSLSKRSTPVVHAFCTRQTIGRQNRVGWRYRGESNDIPWVHPDATVSRYSTRTTQPTSHSLHPTEQNRDEDDIDIEELEQSWRNHPSCKWTVNFRSWRILDGSCIQTIMRNKDMRKYLARQHKISEHLKKQLSAVRDLDHHLDDDSMEGPTRKVILLHPDTPPIDALPSNVREILQEKATDGPAVPMTFKHSDFKLSYLLESLLPMQPPASFETVGHVAHYNLRPQHLPYRFLIGQVLLESLPTIETVIHKVGEVSGPHRTYDYELLAGRNNTNVQLVENGISIQFDLAKVYWCSRLSDERLRLLRDEILAKPPGRPVVLADIFCGVGSLCLQAAAQNVTVLANDWNPEAVRSLVQNAERNGLSHRIQAKCGDAYHYLIDLGIEHDTLPDHVVMNFPLEAPRFLGALRWWPASTTSTSPRLHVYTFIGRDGVNPVPEALLTGRTTMDELNDEYDCNAVEHTVREVAPGKSVVCVSFSATNKLLQHMRGEFW